MRSLQPPAKPLRVTVIQRSTDGLHDLAVAHYNTLRNAAYPDLPAVGDSMLVRFELDTWRGVVQQRVEHNMFILVAGTREALLHLNISDFDPQRELSDASSGAVLLIPGMMCALLSAKDPNVNAPLPQPPRHSANLPAGMSLTVLSAVVSAPRTVNWRAWTPQLKPMAPECARYVTYVPHGVFLVTHKEAIGAELAVWL
jgi:hypothetical protein